MAQNSKQSRCVVGCSSRPLLSLKVALLTNTQTEMFPDYAGNARSSCLVGAVASCFTQAVLLQHLNFDPRNCCASVERSMS